MSAEIPETLPNNRRSFLRGTLTCLAAGFTDAPLVAREVQSHGLRFEHWLCDTFFEGYRGTSYTQKWDIPAEFNPRHGHLPVNPKAVQHGSSIGLGDALRQFDITRSGQSFLLIVAFWEQTDKTTKSWTNVQAVEVRPTTWQQLWNPLQRSDVERLDAIVKDEALSIEQARAKVAKLKSLPPFNATLITLNPKLDRSQRRLQCSLRFSVFFDHLAPMANRERIAIPTLWGVPVPALHNAAARTFD